MRSVVVRLLVSILCAGSIIAQGKPPIPKKPPVLEKAVALKKLNDYTADSKAMKELLSNHVKCVRVSPYDDAPLKLPLSEGTSDINSIIKWDLSPTTIELHPDRAIACFDAPATMKSKWSATVLSKDVSAADLNSLEESVASKLTNDTNDFYVIYADLSNRNARVSSSSSVAGFKENWREVARPGARYRFMLLENAVVFSAVPPDADERRQSLVREYVADCQSLLQNPQTALDHEAVASLCTRRINTLFETMRSQGVIDDKMMSYELTWQARRGCIGGESREVILDELTRLLDDLVLAARNTKCTVTVLSTRGEGAQISAAKADKHWNVIGRSIITTELERARYYFESHRDGKLTGKTQRPIACTGKTRVVTIDEEGK